MGNQILIPLSYWHFKEVLELIIKPMWTSIADHDSVGNVICRDRDLNFRHPIYSS